MKNVYLDTNIILDFLDKKRHNHQKAKELIYKLTEENYTITLSEDMISTIFYIDKDNKKVLKFFSVIIDEWNIVPFGKSVIRESINLCQNNFNQDLEDTLQCLCAKKNSCDLLISNDMKFIKCEIKVVGYDAFK